MPVEFHKSSVVVLCVWERCRAGLGVAAWPSVAIVQCSTVAFPPVPTQSQMPLLLWRYAKQGGRECRAVVQVIHFTLWPVGHLPEIPALLHLYQILLFTPPNASSGIFCKHTPPMHTKAITKDWCFCAPVDARRPYTQCVCSLFLQGSFSNERPLLEV